MAKAFRMEFDITSEHHALFVDSCIWPKIKKYTGKELLGFVFKYMATVPKLKLKFYDLKRKGLLGLYYNIPYDTINLSSELRVNEVPAVFIHEVLHAIFPQIEEDKYIQNMEHKVCRYIIKSKTFLNTFKIMSYVFTNTSWRKEACQMSKKSKKVSKKK